MKKFILIMAIIGLLLTQAFSQISLPFKGDPALRKFSDLRNQEPFKLKDPTYLRPPGNGLMTPNYFSFPKYNERHFLNRQIPLESRAPEQSIDGMPCLIPQGHFSMPIVKPDSTIKYTLLVKRYR